MAYRPRASHDDASRNLISNIHACGVAFDQAADRIARLAAQMIQLETSGIAVTEQGIAPVTLAPGTPQGTSLGA
jgi:ethanolamine ammonia-lyase small subunit